MTVLLVLGAVAVVIAFLTLRETPREVPELEPVSRASAEELEAAPEGGSPSTAPEPEGEVVVHVGGEVAEPGLYTMPAGSRVADAVEEAGGARADTDLDLLNLARPLADGERILVGVEEEHTVDGASGEAGGPIDINRAGETELRTLPGIGEKRARQILAHREALGGSFGSVDDLLGVEGIAERTLENLRPHVTAG
ncbi:helix-hairpin-helix domain-containing protein [Nocardiopsis alba]|uniref:helix-hairpin-helix domain-containing protein n=1 Tax=Nocardiopsis alba TaxID=53437 RepID=UPI0036706AB9